MDVLVVDAANVVGSRPDGWWRDRAGAAARLRDRLVAVSGGPDPGPDAVRVWLVLEGAARPAAPAGRADGVRTVHAERDGDATIVAETGRAREEGHRVLVVTADRGLRERVQALGACVVGPSWLLQRI